MLSIYRLIFNYIFFSFLVFCSHFYVIFLCIFLAGYKSHENTQKELKILKMDADRWVKAESACCSENHSPCNECQSRCSEEPQDQMEIKEIWAYSLQWKSIFAAVKIRGLDLLKVQNPRHKRGSSSHFLGWRGRTTKDQFLEREKLRNPLFLEDSH